MLNFSTPTILLVLQTISVWFLIFFLYKQKDRFTLIPLYSLIAVLTFATHNLADLGFAITLGNFYFLISSVTFFTSLMLGVLVLYIFEGPRAARLALWVILFTSFFYVALVLLLSKEADTTSWVKFSFLGLKYYFWSILAIVLDFFFITISWGILEKVKIISVIVRVFLVILGTFFLDSFIFLSGIYFGQEVYRSILEGSLLVRAILTLMATPVITVYLKFKGYTKSTVSKNVWEIFNFRNDLEIKVQSMEEMIKQQKKTSEELDKIRETYFLALEGSQSGIWDWDIKTNEVNVSKRFYELLGFNKEVNFDTIEKLRELIHPSDTDLSILLTLNSQKGKENSLVSEYRLKTNDGYKWFQNSAIVKYDAKGKPIRVVGSITNIEEKKKLLTLSEERAQAAEQANKAVLNILEDIQKEEKQATLEKVRYESLLSSIGDGVVATDNDGAVVFTNDEIERMLGFSEKEILGKKWGSEIPEVIDDKGEEIPVSQHATPMAMKELKKVKTEYNYKRKDGIPVPVSVVTTPVMIENQLMGVVIVVHDVTKEKQIEKMKDEFVSVASHELRTPMTAIKGFASMILEGDYGKVPEKVAEPLKDIASSTERLIHLVNDMLNISRIEAGRLKFVLKEIDPSEIVKKLIDSLSPIAKQKGLTLEVEKIQKEKVLGDGDKIAQVLSNLVGNSLKFTEKGYIKIYSQTEGDFYKIFVEDSGIGISKEDQDKLFSKFEQVTTQKTGKPQGTGLGLYISRQIARKIGGDVWIEKSQPRKGSTFGYSLLLSKSKKTESIKEMIEKESKQHPDQKELS